MNKLLSRVVGKRTGLLSQQARKTDLELLQEAQQANDAFRALIKSDPVDTGSHTAQPDEKANPHHTSRRSFKSPGFKVPAIFRKNIWPYVIVGLFFNAKIQNADMRNNLQEVSYKTFQLTPEQMGSDSLYTAAAQVVTFNTLTQKSDTSYRLLINPQHLTTSLLDQGHSKQAEFLSNASSYVQSLDPQLADKMERTAERYEERDSKIKHVPEDVLAQAKFTQYQPSGAQQFNDAESMKKHAQGKSMRHIDEDKIIRSPNAFTDIFFPTGTISLDTRHIMGSTGSSLGVKYNFTEDELRPGTMTIDGKQHQYEEKLQQFIQNTTLVGAVDIDEAQFKSIMSGQQIKLGK